MSLFWYNSLTLSITPIPKDISTPASLTDSLILYFFFNLSSTFLAELGRSLGFSVFKICLKSRVGKDVLNLLLLSSISFSIASFKASSLTDSYILKSSISFWINFILESISLSLEPYSSAIFPPSGSASCSISIIICSLSLFKSPSCCFKIISASNLSMKLLPYFLSKSSCSLIISFPLILLNKIP